METLTETVIKQINEFKDLIENFDRIELSINGNISQPELIRKVMIDSLCYGLEHNSYEKLSVLYLRDFNLCEFQRIIKVIKNKPIKKLIVNYLYLYRTNAMIYLDLFAIIIDFLKNNNTIESINFNDNHYNNEIPQNTHSVFKLVAAVNNNSSLTDFVFRGLNYPFYMICERNDNNKEIRSKNLQCMCWDIIRNKNNKIDTQTLPKFIVNYYSELYD